MDVLREFDPWRDPLCTCPPKLSLNPYTGCDHACVYCYITSYIPRAFECRPKTDLISRLRRDIEKVREGTLVSMSNSSDPYPHIERNLGLTRECLKLLSQKDLRVQIITKSDLVVRDLDLLSKMRSVVSFTLTTLDPLVSKRLEPGAPPPERRLKALRKLTEAGLPVTVRLDPVILGLNDDEIERIVRSVAGVGAKHVTSSTFKPRPDSWHRIKLKFPKVARELEPLYFEFGTKHRSSFYLPSHLREELMKRVRDACIANGLTFSSCREGLKKISTGDSCDGTHLIE